MSTPKRIPPKPVRFDPFDAAPEYLPDWVWILPSRANEKVYTRRQILDAMKAPRR